MNNQAIYEYELEQARVLMQKYEGGVSESTEEIKPILEQYEEEE